MVIEDADDLVAVAEISVEEPQHLFRGLARTDQDDGLCQRMRCFQHFQENIPRSVDVEECETTEQDNVEARREQSRLHEVQRQNARDHRVEHRVEDLAHGLQDGLHLSIGLHAPQKCNEHERNPKDEIGNRHMECTPHEHPVEFMQAECHFLRKQNREIIKGHKKEGGTYSAHASWHLRSRLHKCTPLLSHLSL